MAASKTCKNTGCRNKFKPSEDRFIVLNLVKEMLNGNAVKKKLLIQKRKL